MAAMFFFQIKIYLPNYLDLIFLEEYIFFFKVSTSHKQELPFTVMFFAASRLIEKKIVGDLTYIIWTCTFRVYVNQNFNFKFIVIQLENCLHYVLATYLIIFYSSEIIIDISPNI